MPWDGRIHSSSKAKVADGTWRQKRNLDPALLSSVTAELKQTMGLGVAVSSTSTPFCGQCGSPCSPGQFYPTRPTNPDAPAVGWCCADCIPL